VLVSIRKALAMRQEAILLRYIAPVSLMLALLPFHAEAQQDRTISDLVIWTTPGPNGQCLQLQPGQLSITAYLVG
jgi:hypothetical protein